MGPGPPKIARGERWSADGVRRPPGLRAWVPGWAHWSWGQSERALVFAGSFASALVVGVFGWGTATGLAALAVAFLMHVASAADAIRQGAFPGFGRWVPTVSASVGLSLGCYVPVLGLAAVLAWPGSNLGAPDEGYLVNRLAYSSEPPKGGQWIGFETGDGRGHGVARVLAGPGLEVEWANGRLRVGDRLTPWQPPLATLPPDDLAFTVPDGHVLIAETAGLDGEAASGLVLLPQHRITGRAWARMYPVWERRLLL